MASPILFPYGPAQSPDNVTALAAGAAKVLGQIGAAQTAVFDYAIGPLQFRTGAGAAGTVDFLIATSETPGATGNWTDGINPTLTTDQSTLITAQMPQVASVSVNTGAQLYKAAEFGLYNKLLGLIPMYWCLIIRNNTNAALDATATNFVFHYSQLNFAAPVPLVYA